MSEDFAADLEVELMKVGAYAATDSGAYTHIYGGGGETLCGDFVAYTRDTDGGMSMCRRCEKSVRGGAVHRAVEKLKYRIASLRGEDY